MKFHDEYIVWGVVIAVIVFVVVYAFTGTGRKEYFVSEKCWGPETPMSAATGYSNRKDTGQRDYTTYIGEKLIKDGKCPGNLSAQDCANGFGGELLGSLDSAKGYCSTVNCTGILSSDGPSGKMFIPLTSPLMKTVPTLPDGNPIPTDKLPRVILSTCDTQEKIVPPTSTPATAAIAAPTGPGDSYVLKSSLVPCTCTIHSMGCERHAGSKPSSTAPGDKDAFPPGKSDQLTAQPQKDLMRPFSSAFANQGEPTGFLNSFSAFA
jgi:hypothetical protein